MTIAEIINSYDKNKLTRIEFIPDGKCNVVQSHTIGLYQAIELCCENGCFSLKDYYSYLEVMRSNYNYVDG
jgi:hypothetical protein